MIDTFTLLEDIRAELLLELGADFPLPIYTEISDVKDDAQEFVTVQLAGDGSEIVAGNQTRRVPCAMKIRLNEANWLAEDLKALVTRTAGALHRALSGMRGMSPGGGYCLLDAEAGLPGTGTDGFSWLCNVDFELTIQF